MMFKKIILCLLVFACLSSCKKEEEMLVISPTPTFVVENNKEEMPVWVHGNEASKYIVLAVHGGPGSNALDFRTYKEGLGFRKIEEDYLVAYWQQRASGQSSGENDNNLFTIDQYVDDTDKVIDELRTRYPNAEIILFGHSWGGMLTSSYLKDANRRVKVKAWVDAAGVHNGTTFSQATIDDINSEADARIQANENVAYWEDIKQQLLDNPGNANALAYGVVENIPEVPIKVNNADFKFTSRAETSNQVLFTEIRVTDNTSIISSSDFTLPTLILWGQYDFAVSKTLRDEVIDNISSNEVTNVLFPASGHYMMFHEPDLFASSMTDFIGSL